MSEPVGDRRPPRVWLLMGAKAGDNTQILALAEALGWPFETKHLVFRRHEFFANLFKGPSIDNLVFERSSPLEPPWPDLVISGGRRNEPLVRWIGEQAGRKTVRLVHVGRPWNLHECFDLIITTPQYGLPDKPNILHNELPLQRVHQERLARDAETWRPRLAHLPEPRIALLLGGHSGPYNFDRENGALIGRLVGEMTAARGGSLLITTSARTPEKAIRAITAELAVPHLLHRFVKGQDPADNPFYAFLGLAEEIVVTADSMSMLAEAVATGKPTHIFDLERGPGSRRPQVPRGLAYSDPPSRLGDFHIQTFFFRLGMRLAPQRLSRNVSLIHERQVEAGRAVWFGDPWPADKAPAPPLADLKRAVERVQALFADDAPPVPELPASPLPEWLLRLRQDGPPVRQAPARAQLRS